MGRSPRRTRLVAEDHARHCALPRRIGGGGLVGDRNQAAGARYEGQLAHDDDGPQLGRDRWHGEDVVGSGCAMKLAGVAAASIVHRFTSAGTTRPGDVSSALIVILTVLP